MSREHLTVGFWGKLPLAGDFVGRNLPSPFVRSWDRWAARHLVSLFAEEERGWLRFMLGAGMQGPVVGTVGASADRAGRRFPLTLAAPAPRLSTGLPLALDAWFAAIEAAGDAARAGALDAGGLESRLAAIPVPAVDAAGGAPAPAMVFWTDPFELHAADPEHPRETLSRLLDEPIGAG